MAEDKVNARPIREGKDPLAEGNHLINPTNTEAHNTYRALEFSDDVRREEKNNTRMKKEYHVEPVVAPGVSNIVATKKVRKIPNNSEKDLAQAIKKRKGR